MVHWLRIYLPMQETWVQSLVQEDPTRQETTKLTYHNSWALMQQQEKSPQWEACAQKRRVAPFAATRESPCEQWRLSIATSK